MDKKVYCNSCKYFSPDIHVTPLTGYYYNICNRPLEIIGYENVPQNAIYPERNTPVYRELFITCQDSNKNNDCRFYI